MIYRLDCKDPQDNNMRLELSEADGKIRIYTYLRDDSEYDSAMVLVDIEELKRAIKYVEEEVA